MVHFDQASTRLPRCEAAVEAARGVPGWPSLRRPRLGLADHVGMHIACFMAGATHALNQEALGFVGRAIA